MWHHETTLNRRLGTEQHLTGGEVNNGTNQQKAGKKKQNAKHVHAILFNTESVIVSMLNSVLSHSMWIKTGTFSVLLHLAVFKL